MELRKAKKQIFIVFPYGLFYRQVHYWSDCFSNFLLQQRNMEIRMNAYTFRIIEIWCIYFGIGRTIDLAAVMDFVDSGHDLIVAADSSASDFIRNIATESGVDFDVVSTDS